VLLPLVSMLTGALRVGDGWGLANFTALSRTLTDAGLEVSAWEAALNSLRVAVDATVVAVLLGVLVSLLLSRRPRSRSLRRARAVFDGVFMLPLGVSAVTVGFGFLVTLYRPPLDLGGSGVLVPIAQAVVALPLVIRTLLPVVRAIDSRTREAAAVLGATPRQVLTPSTFRAGPLPRSRRRARVRGEPRRVRRHHVPVPARPAHAAGGDREAGLAGRGEQPRDRAGGCRSPGGADHGGDGRWRNVCEPTRGGPTCERAAARAPDGGLRHDHRDR
jgi:hypothetical protein